MNCAEARRQLSETLDGTRESAALSRHLAGCRACAAALSRSRALGAALAGLPQERPSAAFNASVLAALSRRPYAFPVAPFVVSLIASSAAVAWVATRFNIGVASSGALAAKSLAWAHAALRVAEIVVPRPAFDAQYLVAAVLGAALFLTITLPSSPKIRRIGANI